MAAVMYKSNAMDDGAVTLVVVDLAKVFEDVQLVVVCI